MTKYVLAIFLMAAPASAQMPEQVNDTAIMENQEFLLQNINRLTKDMSSINALVVDNSSTTVIPQANFTQTSYAACFAGSTVTITTSASQVKAGFSGVLCNDTNGVAMHITFMIDGVAQVGLGYVQTPSAGGCANAAFTYITEALSAGTHSFCLTAKTANNTGILRNDADKSNQFWVQELR